MKRFIVVFLVSCALASRVDADSKFELKIDSDNMSIRSREKVKDQDSSYGKNYSNELEDLRQEISTLKRKISHLEDKVEDQHRDYRSSENKINDLERRVNDQQKHSGSSKNIWTCILHDSFGTPYTAEGETQGQAKAKVLKECGGKLGCNRKQPECSNK